MPEIDIDVLESEVEIHSKTGAAPESVAESIAANKTDRPIEGILDESLTLAPRRYSRPRKSRRKISQKIKASTER